MLRSTAMTCVLLLHLSEGHGNWLFFIGLGFSLAFSIIFTTFVLVSFVLGIPSVVTYHTVGIYPRFGTLVLAQTALSVWPAQKRATLGGIGVVHAHACREFVHGLFLWPGDFFSFWFDFSSVLFCFVAVVTSLTASWQSWDSAMSFGK